jgi:hypothetical protein
VSDILQRVDEMCAAGGVTRVDVLYAVLGALCPPNAPNAPDVEAPVYIKAAIMRAMRSNRRVTLHQLRRLTNSNKYGIGLWDKALKSLVQAGAISVTQGERRNTKVCTLLKGSQ